MTLPATRKNTRPIRTLNRAGRRHELGKVTAFWKPKGEGHQHDYPP
jgi:hypothetical protein